MEKEGFQYFSSFNTTAHEYVIYPNDSLQPALKKNLDAISTLTDFGIFDPSTCKCTEFYVNIYNLMNVLSPRSNLIWDAISVLQTACRNSAAKHALIHTYKFTPILTKLLEINLTLEKRLRVLRLLQELTYGIKILWLEPHLVNLLKTLSQRVVESSEEEEITLSLSVLVNLCYKNLPAMYSLMRSINTKTFLQSVVKTRSQNVNIRVQCCKLLIVLEYTNAELMDSNVLDVATVTFTNIIPAIENGDVLLLRHIVDFFNDISKNQHFKVVLLTYSRYVKDVKNILESLQSCENQECVCLTMEFLLSIVKLKVEDLLPLYSDFVKLSMNWVQDKFVSYKAFELIKAIVIDSRRTKSYSEIMEVIDLNSFSLIIKNQQLSNSIQNNFDADIFRNFSGFLQLLQELVKTPAVRTEVLKIYPAKEMNNLLQPLLQSNEEWEKLWEKPISFFKEDSSDFYIHALTFTSELAANNSSWLTLYSELLKTKQIQKIMALKLFVGESDIRQKVLNLTKNGGFPPDCITALAQCMSELEPKVLVQGKMDFVASNISTFVNRNLNETMPVLSVAQEERLDLVLHQLQGLATANELANAPISFVMELYESKLTSMTNEHKATKASLEASNFYSTSLEHRLAEIISQSSQLRKILLNTQQCLEGSQAEKIALIKKLTQAEEETKTLHNAKINEIKNLRNMVVDKDNQIASANEKIRELTAKIEEIPILLNKIKNLENEMKQLELNIRDLSSKNSDLNKSLQKMQENLSKKDQIIEENSKELASNRKDIAALNQDVHQHVQQCNHYQRTISDLEQKLADKVTELKELSQMRDMIFQLTAKKKDHSV